MLEEARATLSAAANVGRPNPDSEYRATLIAEAQAEATLAVAEELRALREHLEGGAIEIHYGGSVTP